MTRIEHLIRLANRIGYFFEAMPDRRAGLDGIADHIRRFWEPRMRRALLDYLHRHPDGCKGDVVLSDICLQAIARHRDHLYPQPAAPDTHAPAAPGADITGATAG